MGTSKIPKPKHPPRVPRAGESLILAMPLQRRPIALGEEDREDLRQMSVSRTLAPGDVLRARVILMLAEGRSYAEIQQRLGTTAPTIARWKKRFMEHGLTGLVEQRSSERKTIAVTPELREQVIAATCRGPDDRSARWSCRALARELGISKDIVHRIWRSEGMRPHRLERYMATGEEELQRKGADIVGLYLSPLQHAAVFCASQKSAAAAAAHGRLSLYRALSATSGGVQPASSARRAGDGYVSFLTQVLGGYQAGLRLTVILDRLSGEDTVKLGVLLEEHPSTWLNLAPSYSAWLEQVEEWCSPGDGEAKLTWKLMRHIQACSKPKIPVQWIYAGS